MRTLAVFLAILLAAGSAGFVLAGCERTPTVDDYLAKSKINGRDRIRIAINGDQPLMGLRDPITNTYSGFDIEIARYIARSLGFTTEDEIVWSEVEVEDRERELENNQVDLVVASYSITEERAKQVNFAGPYLVTSQEVLVPADRVAELNSIPKLMDKRVCTSGGSTSEAHLRDKGIVPLTEISDQSCVKAMLAGECDALSTDLTVLAGFSSQYPGKFEIVDVPIGESERLGIGVAKSDPYLRDVVTRFLWDSYRKGEDGAWRVAFDKTLRSELPSWAGLDQQPEPTIYQELRDHDDAG